MVVPADQDGKTDDCLALQRDITVPEVSSRQGGQTNTEIPKQVIIVDMREFRSELPVLIHKRGIDIEPVTIAVKVILLNFITIKTIFTISDRRLYFNTRNLCREKELFRSYRFS